jgi:hypothetical protein
VEMAGRIREPAAFGSGGYLKAAGIAVRRRGRPSESKPQPAISVEVSTETGPPKAAAMFIRFANPALREFTASA